MPYIDTKNWTKEDWVRAAAEYCAAHNLTVPDGKSATDAANEHAYDAEVTRLRTSGQVFFDFDGDDSCENCSGWNGEDRRCDCGNRRDSWTSSYGHSFVNPSVYAEAW